MKIHQRIVVTTLVVGVLAMGLTARPAKALSLGDILKVGGIAFLVSEYGDRINDFINNALGEREAQAAGATKVVPILSLGRGVYLGAAQVVGAPDRVQTVKAVVQGTVTVGSFRGTAYIPVATKGGLTNPERVTGAGVSAVINFRI
jgi:hypothetical protein